MSEHRESEAWWPYVKNVIRRYPYLLDKMRALKNTQTTAQYGKSEGSGSNEPGRKTERIALRELPEKEQIYYDAVTKAIQTTRYMRDGAIRVRLIELVYFRKSHTLYGASAQVHVSERTARRWHSEFVRLVAQYLNLQ